MERVRILISGRVQGVGFRYHTCAHAQAAGIRGWVRNTRDGRVEAEFEGTAEALSDMVAWCRRGPITARVDEVVEVSRERDTTPVHSGFSMRG